MKRETRPGRDEFAELLPIRERVLGPVHPETLNVRASLANWTLLRADSADEADHTIQGDGS